MKYSSLLIILVIISFHSKGQRHVGTAGTTFANNIYVIEFSVGEIAITTASSPTLVITQGLLQPALKSHPNDCSALNDNLSAHPNPVTNIVFIQGADFWLETCHVYSYEGKLIKTTTLERNQVDLTGLAAGIYFLRVSPSCQGKYRILKIVKL